MEVHQLIIWYESEFHRVQESSWCCTSFHRFYPISEWERVALRWWQWGLNIVYPHIPMVHQFVIISAKDILWVQPLFTHIDFGMSQLLIVENQRSTKISWIEAVHKSGSQPHEGTDCLFFRRLFWRWIHALETTQGLLHVLYVSSQHVNYISYHYIFLCIFMYVCYVI